MEPGNNGSARLPTLCLNTTEGTLTLISFYTPTLTATFEAKEEFYDNLATTIGNIPSSEQLILLCDFIATVGADYDYCLGTFGVGKMNKNGQ